MATKSLPITTKEPTSNACEVVEIPFYPTTTIWMVSILFATHSLVMKRDCGMGGRDKGTSGQGKGSLPPRNNYFFIIQVCYLYLYVRPGTLREEGLPEPGGGVHCPLAHMYDPVVVSAYVLIRCACA